MEVKVSALIECYVVGLLVHYSTVPLQEYALAPDEGRKARKEAVYPERT